MNKRRGSVGGGSHKLRGMSNKSSVSGRSILESVEQRRRSSVVSTGSDSDGDVSVSAGGVEGPVDAERTESSGGGPGPPGSADKRNSASSGIAVTDKDHESFKELHALLHAGRRRQIIAEFDSPEASPRPDEVPEEIEGESAAAEKPFDQQSQRVNPDTKVSDEYVEVEMTLDQKLEEAARLTGKGDASQPKGEEEALSESEIIERARKAREQSQESNQSSNPENVDVEENIEEFIDEDDEYFDDMNLESSRKGEGRRGTEEETDSDAIADIMKQQGYANSMQEYKEYKKGLLTELARSRKDLERQRQQEADDEAIREAEENEGQKKQLTTSILPDKQEIVKFTDNWVVEFSWKILERHRGYNPIPLDQRLAMHESNIADMGSAKYSFPAPMVQAKIQLFERLNKAHHRIRQKVRVVIEGETFGILRFFRNSAEVHRMVLTQTELYGHVKPKDEAEHFLLSALITQLKHFSRTPYVVYGDDAYIQGALIIAHEHIALDSSVIRKGQDEFVDVVLEMLDHTPKPIKESPKSFGHERGLLRKVIVHACFLVMAREYYAKVKGISLKKFFESKKRGMEILHMRRPRMSSLFPSPSRFSMG